MLLLIGFIDGTNKERKIFIKRKTAIEKTFFNNIGTFSSFNSLMVGHNMQCWWGAPIWFCGCSFKLVLNGCHPSHIL